MHVCPIFFFENDLTKKIDNQNHTSPKNIRQWSRAWNKSPHQAGFRKPNRRQRTRTPLRPGTWCPGEEFILFFFILFQFSLADMFASRRYLGWPVKFRCWNLQSAIQSSSADLSIPHSVHFSNSVFHCFFFKRRTNWIHGLFVSKSS